jgi:hypothetical protein
MPLEPRNRCIGALTEVVIKYFVDRAMALSDISEEETHKLHELLKGFIKLTELFPNPDVRGLLVRFTTPNTFDFTCLTDHPHGVFLRTFRCRLASM